MVRLARLDALVAIVVQCLTEMETPGGNSESQMQTCTEDF